MSSLYNLGWAVVLLPLLGAVASFLCERPRRAAQTVLAFNLVAFAAATFLLVFRLIHRHEGSFDSLFGFFQASISSGNLGQSFAADFHPQLGIRIDNFSVAFCALVLFVFLGAMTHATISMRGDAAYRRLYWIGSLLVFGMLGLIAAPNLFQAWFMWEIVGVCTFVLVNHWWENRDVAVAARRVFVLLRIGDVALLLGVIISFIRLGSAGEALPPVGGATSSDAFDLSVLRAVVNAVHSNSLSGIGSRTLLVLGALFVVAGLIRAAQFPFTLWLSETTEAPLPGIVLLTGMVTSSGIILLAKLWPFLLAVPHLLSLVALVGVLTGLVGGVVALFQREVVRFIVWVSAAQLGLILIGLGMGGYAPALQALFMFILFTAVLVLGCGNLVRRYRTRNLAEMGGAWSRMRSTSLLLGAWWLGIAGLNLASYNIVAAAWRNTFADQLAAGASGHVAGWVRVVAIVGSVLTAFLMSLAGGRFLFQVCRGEPASRRGFATERIREVEPRLIATTGILVLGALLAIVASIPNAVRGLTFSHFVYFGDPGATPRPELPQSLTAIGEAIGLTITAGLAAILVTSYLMPRLLPWLSERFDRRVFNPDLWLGPAVFIGVDRAVTWVARLFGRVDQDLVGQLEDSGGAAVAVMASAADRSRTSLFQVQIVLAVAVTLVVIVGSVLFATGHLGVH